MSFDDRKCPCGGRKESGMMLCDRCQDTFRDRPEMKRYLAEHTSVELRRAAAIRLLGMSRARLARKLRVSSESVRHWENGLRIPSPPVQVLLRLLESKFDFDAYLVPIERK